MNKTYAKSKKTCRVTFELPAEVKADEVFVVGDFNDWNASTHPLKQRKDGRFSTSISLAAGSQYQFRYLVDGERWENDWAADAYLPNSFGTENSVVAV